MKRSIARAVIGLLRGRGTAGDVAMRQLTGYFIAPLWIGAGLADYFWHRHTKIETTSGIDESLIHWLMAAEATPAVLAPLFLEMNEGALGGIIGLAALHELTVLWDLWFTAPRRAIPAGEQVTHTFLEAAPFFTAAAAIATHWDEFQSLLGRGGKRRMSIRLRRPPMPARHVAAMLAAVLLLDALPHTDELRRCWKAARLGKVGRDTPECLTQVYG